VEKDIQQEREKSVLQEIFLSLEMVPETPAEPDPEPYELVPPKIIPIDDVSLLISYFYYISFSFLKWGKFALCQFFWYWPISAKNFCFQSHRV